MIVVSTGIIAQVADSVKNVPELAPSSTSEQQLENITENNEDAETEDDSYLQELVQFQRNPVNLNTADEALLKELMILSPLQIQNLVIYRNLMGNLIDIYELQAIPGWNIRMIQRLLPYVSIGRNGQAGKDLSSRFSNGQHSILFRYSQTLERSEGFLIDHSSTKSFYYGSPQKLMLRYKYVYKNLLQYGIVAEKDAGEEFFKGSQKSGFDFYSAHLFIRNLGIIKSLALGDFTVNLGQGLTQWQSLAFKKGPDIVSIKRQSAVLRPYNSAAEINFHRGAGITIGKRNWQLTVFGSYRKTDANFVTDTLQTTDDYISSLQTSGYHRTKSEIEDKGSQRQLAYGGNASIQSGRLHIGVNAIQFQFKVPLVKEPLPYNSYALSGKHFGNYSVDYSYTFKNLHFFGEAAMSSQNGTAFINGLLVSVSNNVDMSLLYRNISRKYQSLYTNAFTESTLPSNEKGLFTGITIRPAMQWQIDAYMDIYKFPWLRYRVDAPTNGTDYFAQVTYKPNKQLEIYSRYKRESKAINYNPEDLILNPVILQPRKNWRTQLGYKISPTFTIRNRVEMVWFDKKGGADESGFLMYVDLFYKPMMKRISANFRLQYFETQGYNSRLYAYESDVLYYFSIPVFYDKGYRYYINCNYDFSKKLSVWVKFGQFLYANKAVVGSGLDEIKGNRKSEIRAELQYKF
ncbi:MAG: helix-hairpin-helix domain-containing protein [Bacteroidetes bacterium]|nr:helix-hairpin-helix domain-containing protein [Bacteroidota bacterium]